MRARALGFFAALVLVATAALGQDKPWTPDPPTPAPKPMPRPAAQEPEVPLEPVDVAAAIDAADRARDMAHCLTEKAKAVDGAVAGLRNASPTTRAGARLELDHALEELEGCQSPLVPGVDPFADAPIAADALAPAAQPAPPRDEPAQPAELAETEKPKSRVRLRSLGIDMPRCRPGDPLCSDIVTTDRSSLDRAVRVGMPSFARCYDKSTVAKKRGSMAVTLHLGTLGGAALPVSTSVSEDTLGDEGLGDCVQRAAGRLRFPAEADGATVHLGLRFAPK
jgi:hypothetical protein